MGRNNRHDANVIHVVFGPGGGRVQSAFPIRGGAIDSPIGVKEPLTDLFTCGEISRLLGMSPTRLRSLDRSGVVSPSGRRKGRRAYTFQDLIALRAAQTLLEQRVRLRDVSRAIEALKRSLPRVTRPLAELRVMSDGRRVVVRSQEGTAYEPLTGQLLLDLEIRSLRDDVVRVLRPSAGRERARTAYELYLRASQLDENPATMAEAASLYEQAIQNDPWLAIAYTNLGNIRFRSNDPDGAECLYRKALDMDPSQPEAQYSLISHQFFILTDDATSCVCGTSTASKSVLRRPRRSKYPSQSCQYPVLPQRKSFPMGLRRPNDHMLNDQRGAFPTDLRQ